MMKRWIAVRCCCQPSKVFGFVCLNENLLDRNRRVRLALKPKGSVAHFDPDAFLAMSTIEPIGVDVKLDTISNFGDIEIAIYSEDRPMEFWRTVSGFVEAK